ncbi:TetR family transcriptional regulator [Agromyces albus]|uniref:TetR family transcriptional regulator n=1 Tax=Agromyces albus TaxID=205332 RepID=UPI002787E317|nr:TetR family transcriptional regulator [Agromyces albus]MDQ0574308.1 TetR/AcrR family tetracycline transcriptional repressor [Agromyces albus]
MASTKRQPLTRAGIELVALDLVNEVGLDALSMRRLADRLGVQSPALYWHFRNKQELLEGMAERIYLAGGMGAPSDGEAWQDWIMRRSIAYRAALNSCRDGARIAAEASGGSPTLIGLFDEEIRSMVGFGFTPALALHTISVITHYISGFALKEQAPGNQATPVGGAPLDISDTLKTAFAEGGGPLSTEVFEHGIRMIVAGVSSELGSIRPA